ncbi:hypothetical protein NKW54_08670 [Acetobacter cerevisiae]|uniref:Uncharacterized protein n=1 Tax=Acetobacter cerevisiae TaxID=178900 RepID=A0A149UU74_9PROT|nr:hypothetical protein [Acetobacter cerevisiae]KXV71393.1 hypothetical protein AD952_09205 [Acetobacter cerevisiae]MCP1246012.1 hypothetical protein [Acetobacter cerevisiae]MCP1255730.1 hypothetical protein [Acetobacter cerevisiae]
MTCGRYEITIPITIGDAMALLRGIEDAQDIAQAALRLNENISRVGKLIERHPEPEASEGY